jgi:hypothetical protein
MTHTALASLLGHEFDDFLFASVGEDRNGKPLSVLSALARSDVDPWQEATELMQLPREPATQRLTALIAALPDEPWADLAPGTIAARLIALLPRRINSKVPARRTSLGSDAMTNPQAVVCLIFYVLLMILVLGNQSITTSRQQPVPRDNAHAPTILPVTLLPTTAPR